MSDDDALREAVLARGLLREAEQHYRERNHHAGLYLKSRVASEDRNASAAEALRLCDEAALSDVLRKASARGALEDVLQEIVRASPLPTPFRESVARLVLKQPEGTLGRRLAGQHIRLNVARALLPSYTGGPLTLYRGQRATEHHRSTYGISWTKSLDRAREYAAMRAEQWQSDGVVVLKLSAPASAIVAEYSAIGVWDHSEEVFVDPAEFGDATIEVIDTWQIS